jgi:hypothetical protein
MRSTPMPPLPVLRRRENIATPGRQPGAPAPTARAITTALEADTPLSRLVLGRFAVQRIRAEMDAQRREIDAWEDVANGAHHPEPWPV